MLLLAAEDGSPRERAWDDRLGFEGVDAGSRHRLDADDVSRRSVPASRTAACSGSLRSPGRQPPCRRAPRGRASARWAIKDHQEGQLTASDQQDRVQWMPLEDLEFDPQNPRLEDNDRGASQEEASQPSLTALRRSGGCSVVRAARDFPSEVVLGVASLNPGKVVIVEGNRRLAASKGLANDQVRSAMSEPLVWKRLSDLAQENGNVPVRIPVLVEPDRAAVIATIGYRHISGIEPWEPYQQARYIAERVDVDALQFKEVAELVGVSETQVRGKYRNYSIVRIAEDAGVSAALIQESFGVWDAALGRVPIRQFIQAADPGAVRAKSPPSPPRTSRNFAN